MPDIWIQLDVLDILHRNVDGGTDQITGAEPLAHQSLRRTIEAAQVDESGGWTTLQEASP